MARCNEMGKNLPHVYGKGNMSAFVWWAGARPCTTTGENLIQLEEALPSTYYYKVPRYYTYGQFTKYIERNARRVDVEAISSETDKFLKNCWYLLTLKTILTLLYWLIHPRKSHSQH